MTAPFEPAPGERVPALVEQFKGGLAAPICLTWEWTYACNLSCAHCLSSSGRRDPVASQIGVKFSTNGLRLDAERAQRLAATEYVDMQISLDGASRQVNDAVRGPGSYDMALGAMENLAAAGVRDFKISVVTGDSFVKGHGASALPGPDRSRLPRPEKDHSHRGRAVPLGVPSVHVPAKLCDSSPLAVTP